MKLFFARISPDELQVLWFPTHRVPVIKFQFPTSVSFPPTCPCQGRAQDRADASVQGGVVASDEPDSAALSDLIAAQCNPEPVIVNK